MLGPGADSTSAIAVSERALVVAVPDAAWSGEIRLREADLVAALERAAAGSGIRHIRTVPSHASEGKEHRPSDA